MIKINNGIARQVRRRKMIDRILTEKGRQIILWVILFIIIILLGSGIFWLCDHIESLQQTENSSVVSSYGVVPKTQSDMEALRNEVRRIADTLESYYGGK